MAIPKLAGVAVGSPITRLGISFFPLYLPGNELPTIATGDGSGLVVDELEAASVPALRVSNPTDKPVLVVEGEQFVGGMQNRAGNATVLVPSLHSLDIPVSCLERGRWGHYRAYRRDAAFAPFRVRATQDAAVARSMRRNGSRTGDQGAVWREVDEALARRSVRSATAAAADIADTVYQRGGTRAAAMKELAALGPLPGQCGLVVGHGRWVVAMDLFGAPRLLTPHWKALIRSHLLESPVANGRPSATRVLRMIGYFGTTEAQEAPSIGLGTEHRIADDRLTGQALTLNGAVVHATFFAAAPR